MPKKLKAVVIDETGSDVDESSFFDVNFPETDSSDSESDGDHESEGPTNLETRVTSNSPPVVTEDAVVNENPSARTRSQQPLNDDDIDRKRLYYEDLADKSIDRIKRQNVSKKSQDKEKEVGIYVKSLDPDVLARIKAIKARQNKRFTVIVHLHQQVITDLEVYGPAMHSFYKNGVSFEVSSKTFVGDLKKLFLQRWLVKPHNVDGLYFESFKTMVEPLFSSAVAFHKDSVIQDNVELSILTDETKQPLMFVFMTPADAEANENKLEEEKKQTREALEQKDLRDAADELSDLDEKFDEAGQEVGSVPKQGDLDDVSVEDKFLVKIRGNDNKMYEVMIRPQTKVSDMIDYYRKKRGLGAHIKLTLEFDSDSMDPQNTAADYELENEYVIDALII